MKFLVDQDVYGTTSAFLKHLGHDVVRVSQLGLSAADDADILRVARDESRILVTRDRDFGALVFVRHAGPGILYLRILPSSQDAVHNELERVLTTCTETELQASFVVVEPGRHRIRRFR